MIDSDYKINTQQKETIEQQNLLRDIYVAKQFTYFLIKNKALNSYLKNLKKGCFYRFFTSNGFLISTFIKKTFETDPTNLITNGFNWKKSKEGFDYWCDMHTSWLNTYYKSLINFNRIQRKNTLKS